MRRIVLNGERQVVTSEQIGTLHYSNAYAAVLSPQTGRVSAVVSLPFFESVSYLQRSQILILSNILQVFVVVFLIFTLLSFLAADNLAFPIRFITKKLRQTTFAGENKPLEWSARDEIGMLVNEYNRMVRNLEDSKRALARSEKESAWREMAKQVAHEIKNPLTPMKLTLQQMEQNLRSGELDSEKSKKSVDVLLRQVEILNAIASSFSMFARMPAPAPQRLDLAKLLSETTNLFVTSENADVSFVAPSEPCWVSVDPASFGRAVSNILINATQARAEGRKLALSVTVTRTATNVVVAIGDNGIGIPIDLQEHIFQPQFTTKEAGSGLGLIMARQIVLQASGRIWFESIPGQGTTFFIELPVAP
jgi:nitrogen fixation/metabolism regulation signal transduction histidine kinase